jgi:hypothetical protein
VEVNEKVAAEIETVLRLLLTEYERPQYGQAACIAALLNCLLTLAARAVDPGHRGARPAVVGAERGSAPAARGPAAWAGGDRRCRKG